MRRIIADNNANGRSYVGVICCDFEHGGGNFAMSDLFLLRERHSIMKKLSTVSATR